MKIENIASENITRGKILTKLLIVCRVCIQILSVSHDDVKNFMYNMIELHYSKEKVFVHFDNVENQYIFLTSRK